MPRYQSAALREERANLHGQLAAIYTAAEGENRDLTAEETQNAERIESRFLASTAELRQLEIVEGYAPEQRQGERTRPQVEPNGAEQRDVGERGTEEYRDAFMGYLRTGQSGELRTAFSTSPGINGGFAVPESWATGIRDFLVDAGSIRALADVQFTATGNPINMPIVGTKSTAGLRAEAGPIANVESEDTLANVVFNAYEISQLVKTSREFLRDGMNVESWIQRRAGQNLAVKGGGLLAAGAGSGSSQPQGIFPIANTGKTAASATSIAYADLVDLKFSVPGPYRNHPSTAWVVNDLTAAKMCLLTDPAGHLIWVTNVAVGEPDSFMGKPVYTDPAAPTIGTTKDSVAFGAWIEYMIRVVNDIEVQVLNELYAGNGQVGFWVREYLDANLLNFDAIKVLTHP